MADPAQVRYEKNGDSFSLERVDQAEAVDRQLAAGAMLLIAAAYGQQFEAPRGPLPPGTFARRYDPEDDALLERHQQRLHDHIGKKGAQYWLLRSAGGTALEGLSQASPSRATWGQKAGQISPNLYVNDVIVAPARQKQGRGSGLLHVLLKFGGFDDERAVAADAFRESVRLNSRLEERLGILPVEAAVGPFKVGSRELEQVRYATPPQLSLAGVRRRLEQAKPWLETGRLVEA